jgi:GNAT superfamily N-acetyltransferase
MHEPEFIVAHASTHRDELIELNSEYLTWVFAGIETHFNVAADDIVGKPASEYVVTVIDKVCGAPPPEGIFYLLKVDGELAGMGGLRSVRAGVAEIKRLYVRPRFRGMRLGELLLRRLLSDAALFHYASVCLDSALFMTAAHRLYEREGFTDCPLYDGVEVPAPFRARWRYMQRSL